MEKKLKVIKLWSCIAVTLLFTIIVFLCFTLDAKSEIKGSIYYMLSYPFLFLFVIYYAFTLFRIAEHNSKVLSFVIFFLCVTLLFSEYITWISNGVTIPRYGHYFYYLPLLFIPYFFFIMCNEIFVYKRKSRIILYLFLGCISFIFFLLVITNDLHEWVFLFPDGQEKTIDNAIERPLYFFIVFYALFLLFITNMIFIIKTIKRNNFIQLLQPTFVLFLIIGYSFLYVREVPFVINTMFISDAPLVYNLLFILLFEVLMHNGLIQNNGQYLRNFNDCMLPLKIENDSHSFTYMSSLFDEESYQNKNDENKIFIENLITNGRVIIEEDISKINRLSQKLNKNIEKLIQGNEILLKRKDIDEEQARIKTRNELFNEIEKAIYRKSNEIDFLVSLLPDTIDDTNRIYVMDILGKIRLRIGYLKQKCLLILQAKTNKTIASNEFEIIFNVICSDIKNVGFDYFGHVIKGHHEVPVDFALAFNELMEYVGEQFAGKKCSVLVTIDMDKIRCTIRVEVGKKIYKLQDFPSEIIAFGYFVTLKKNKNEYLMILKEGNNNARNL